MPELILAAFISLALILLYCYVLYQNGIIPIGGKKAPSFVIVIFFQWFLVQRIMNQRANEKIHFLHLFAYQYIFVMMVGIISATFFYVFYLSSPGLDVLSQYIQLSLQELSTYKQVIVKQEGGAYFEELRQNISMINAKSIAKDDFFQKIALSFLPNLLISLYYKRS